MNQARPSRYAAFALLAAFAGCSAGQAGPTKPPPNLGPAADLPGVTFVANRSSVRVEVPVVAGAADYRIYAVEDGVTVSTSRDNREHVDGGTVYCGGLRQRNQCDDGEVPPIKYNLEVMDLYACNAYDADRRPNVPTELMRTIEVNNVKPNTTLVIEAIDRPCPFPGLYGTSHLDMQIAAGDVSKTLNVDVVVDNKAYNIPIWQPTFPVRTEAEIRAQYGTMIINGQGPNLATQDKNSPAYPESPFVRLAQPASADDPVVLARTILTVSPSDGKPDGFGDNDFFDDFSDPTDQPKLLRQGDLAEQLSPDHPITVFEMKNWILYDVSNGFSQFFVDRGQLVEVSGDPYQDSMSTQAFYPKRAAKLPTAVDRFLHVSYEVARDETPRRYEMLSFCGSDQMGQTYDGNTPRSAPVPRPGFMNEDDTTRTSPLGWNCLTLTPRGAGYSVVAGGDVKSHSDSSLKVTVVRTHPQPAQPSDYDAVHITPYATAFGPTQDGAYPKRWVRQIDGAGNPSGVWLDDMLEPGVRRRFDVYLRRDRLVVYVEGQQRICQDLDPTAMTMAEAAIGFWHILYHTSAEFTEIRHSEASAIPQTGQHHILHNTPFGDQRAYDNVGFKEDAGLPAGFDAKRCYPAK